MDNSESQQKPLRKRIDAIDACKLIAALFVVGIHTAPLDSLSESANFTLFECFSRFAVPFYFAGGKINYVRICGIRAA